MLVISSRISGWRVTDSITFPKMMPTPMPAPIEPRPAPMPRAIDLRPSSVTWAMGSAMSAISDIEVLLSVPVGGGCLADVDGREGGEDEGLERRHQAYLEQEEDDRERQRQQAEGREAQQHGQSARHEREQQVAGQDVGEQSYGEGG